jgi:hypothetical protein
VWFQRLQSNDDTASRRLGQASFSTLQSFLQGNVSTFNVVSNPTELGWRSLLGAWYVEDTIKAGRRLTLRLGLRDEFSTGWNEAFGRAANYLTNSEGVLVTNTRVASSTFTQNNAKWLLSPRVGLAWDPFGNGKTAVHAGFGSYYTLIDALSFLLNAIPPYNGTLSFAGVPLTSIVPIVPGAQELPSCGPGVSAPCAIYAPQGVQSNAKTPTVEEWNFGIEQQLGSSSILRLVYSGSFADHELLSIDPNTIPAQICSQASCISGGVGQARGSVAEGAQYIPLGTRPNPFLSGGFFWYTEGNSSYNAFQVDLIRRFSRGLQFRANYTWSKNLDINSGLTGAQANNQAQMVLDRNDLRRDWGPAALNITSESSLSGRYELPFGPGRRWFAGTRDWRGKLANGWQLNGIASLLGGFPFTPQIGSNWSGDGDTRNPDRPSVNPAFTGPTVVRSPNGWFNPGAFVLPVPGTYGNLGRGTFTGPGLTELDMSLMKNTRLSVRYNVQFRAEFFNLLNHPNFGTPNPIVFSGAAVSPTAGLVTSTATTSRQIQFGLKVMF